jgi:hypothetical protein
VAGVLGRNPRRRDLELRGDAYLHLEPALTLPVPGREAAFTRATGVALAVILLVALAVRVVGLGQESLWGDEAFTWWWTRQSLTELWGPRAALETNPPLYYSVAWVATRLLGDDEIALRLPSALLGTLGVGAVFLLGRTVAGNRVGLLAALLTAIAAPHVYYSQEARTYALLSLLGTLAVWGCVVFFRAATPPGIAWRRAVSGLLLYLIGTSGALYSHNTAALLPALANLVALGWWLSCSRRWSVAGAWIGANLLVLALWSWWLPALFRQLGGADSLRWIEQPSAFWAARDFVRLYGLRYLPDSKLGQLVPGVLVVGMTLLACIRRPSVATLLLGAIAFGVPSLLFLAGLAGHPVWIERAVFWPLPLGLTLVAILIVDLRPTWLRGAALAAVLAIGVADLLLLQVGRQKEPYREALAAIEADRQPRDAILLVPPAAVMGATYYQARLGLPIDGFAIEPTRERHSMGMPHDTLAMQPPTVSLPTFLAMDDLARIADAHDRVWVLYRRRELADPRDTVRLRLQTLGREVSGMDLPPFLELVLVELTTPRPDPAPSTAAP